MAKQATRERIGQLIAHVENEKKRELSSVYGEEGEIVPLLYTEPLTLSQPRAGLGGRV